MSFNMENESDAREVFTDGSAWVKAANREVRMGFIRKVYSILMVQLALTAAIAAPLQHVSQKWLGEHAWILGACALLSMVLMCAIACFQSAARSFPSNYILLFSFTACEGVIVGFVAATYKTESVAACVGITGLIFAGLTAYACTTKTDFTGLGPYLYGALISLIIYSFVILILRAGFGYSLEYAEMGYDILCILLFVMYIIFDTQLILGGDHKHNFSIDDYVFAALSLYLDIINLFLHLLRLFGQRR
eukprot:gnl/MRDRNA2_/MRDRNA2_272837_c0_seq1.p1 gnl/MRDRNA2_/MRDRNA2_272837_c0~~gnl/MRDRNA2_/MRDRNA2_272837_c0_seq1.p1  ORF type:complete len:248 (-),score=18.85 gnl/MRDRNA2_/MRDRNA2_272837_c0_seq1:12-755(-)